MKLHSSLNGRKQWQPFTERPDLDIAFDNFIVGAKVRSPEVFDYDAEVERCIAYLKPYGGHFINGPRGEYKLWFDTDEQEIQFLLEWR